MRYAVYTETLWHRGNQEVSEKAGLDAGISADYVLGGGNNHYTIGCQGEIKYRAGDACTEIKDYKIIFLADFFEVLDEFHFLGMV